jgi:phage gpG-like protein
MKVNISVDDGATKSLQVLQHKCRDLSPAMDLAGQAMQRSIASHFANERSPDGRPFKPLTLPYLKWKQKQGGSSKILTFRGVLRKSIQYQATPRSVTIFSDVVYAARQQQMRPFIGFSKTSQRTITSIVLRHLAGR